jgi:hypothetical protein
MVERGDTPKWQTPLPPITFDFLGFEKLRPALSGAGIKFIYKID